MSLPRGPCPQCGGLVVGAGVCQTCVRSVVVDAVMAVAGEASPLVVAEVVAEVTDGSAALRSIRQALTDGSGALLVGAPPSVGRLVVALRACGHGIRLRRAHATAGVSPIGPFRGRRRSLALGVGQTPGS